MENNVIIDLKEMLPKKEEPPLSASYCIYRVPHVIREHNTQAYTPKVVSIGPFHHDNLRLQKMETHKQIYFKNFIEQEAIQTMLDDNFVKDLDTRVRACYSENIKLSQNELVKLIYMDAIFIIELFKSFFERRHDSILENPWLLNNIKVDLLLLENQLPFFILEELYDQMFPPNIREDLSSFRELTFHFFSDYNRHNLKLDSNAPIKHFTDLLRTFHIDPNKEKAHRLEFEKTGSYNVVYSASELHEAGVKLKTNESDFLLNLKFSGHVLEIPEILVDDGTEILFRNMLALEQCHYPFECYIIDYFVFLDGLINTSRDVDALVHRRIILNNLGDSNNVVKLFNDLVKDIVRENIDPEYHCICKSLNEFYRDPWNKKKATLRRDYCSTPWQTAASIAGIVIIVLTIVQTICSVIPIV